MPAHHPDHRFSFDGQLISKTGAGEELSYSHGVEGRLEAVRSGDLLLMSAVYDGDGKKVAETTLYHASRTLPEAAAVGTPLGSLAIALARSLGAAAPALSATDELYDVTAFVSSTLFEEEQVAHAASSRSGTSTSIFGLARLAEVREGATTSLLEEARGSVVQERAQQQVPAPESGAVQLPQEMGPEPQKKSVWQRLFG